KLESSQHIAIYSRKSKFTGKGESIDNQIELCKQYIRTHYPDCAEDGIIIYEDEGFSGGNIERPNFKKMMADAKAKKFSAIVCYRLDRISRNIGDFAKLIEELDNLKVAFVSIKEQFDTSSPMGRAMMYISSVFSQLERETIAERIRDNMHELSKTGRWLGGTSPTGYVSESVQNVTVDGKVKKACKLKLIPEEAEVVKLIFKIFLEMNSLSKTETYFLQNGYKTKNDKAFTRFALRNILTNPVYMIADKDAYRYLSENDVDLFAEESDFDSEYGVMAYNRTIQKTGKAHQVRPTNEWIVSVGKHTGLISGADWVRAQGCLNQNRSKSFRKPRSHVALLSGLLFCTCGDYMRPKLSKREDAKGELIYSYLCAMKEKSRSHICKMNNANGNMLDRAVCDEIKKLGEDNSEFIRQLKLGKKQLEGNREKYNDSLERLQANLSENEKEIAGLVSSLGKAAGTSAEGYIVKQIDELHGKGEIIKSRITELESLTASHALSDIEFDIIRQMLSTFKDTLDDMSVEEKRAALRAFVKKVVWGGEHIHVYLFGSDDSSGLALPPMPPNDEGLKKGSQLEPLCGNSKRNTYEH
ncbi:MAG: recombinase family protein, partial [Defluviitaleaceae bacterium]|nr:recombinase family protein [Defluviitaleaceae bacterium]